MTEPSLSFSTPQFQPGSCQKECLLSIHLHNTTPQYFTVNTDGAIYILLSQRSTLERLHSAITTTLNEWTEP